MLKTKLICLFILFCGLTVCTTSVCYAQPNKKIANYVNLALDDAIAGGTGYMGGSQSVSQKISNKKMNKIVAALDEIMAARFKNVVALPYVINRKYSTKGGYEISFRSKVIYYVGDWNTYFEVIRTRHHLERDYYIQYKGNFVYGKDAQAIAQYFYNAPSPEAQQNMEKKKRKVLYEKEQWSQSTERNRAYAQQQSQARKAHNQQVWGAAFSNAAQSATEELQRNIETTENNMSSMTATYARGSNAAPSSSSIARENASSATRTGANANTQQANSGIYYYLHYQNNKDYYISAIQFMAPKPPDNEFYSSIINQFKNYLSNHFNLNVNIGNIRVCQGHYFDENTKSTAESSVTKEHDYTVNEWAQQNGFKLIQISSF